VDIVVEIVVSKNFGPKNRDSVLFHSQKNKQDDVFSASLNPPNSM